MKKKFGLALGVGAARGFAHLGVLQVLEENGIIPDYISGGSMGSLVGGVYALNRNLEEVAALVESYRRADLFVVDVVAAVLKNGVARDGQFIRKMTKVTEGKNIEDCQIPFCCNAVDLVTGEEVVLSQGELWHAIRASCSIPGVLEPVRMGDRVLVDGGLLNRVPTNLVRNMGADVVVGIDCLGDYRSGWEPKNFVNILTRAFEIVDKKTFHSHAVDYDMMLTPSHDTVDAMQFNKKNKRLSIAAGRKVMEENIDRLKKLLS